jgi:tetratricopeptide (TPR) repeat protein
MTRAARLIAVIAWTAAAAHGGECEDARPQLKAVSAALEARDVPKAEQLLDAVATLQVKCPQVALAFARVYLAKGDIRGADAYSEMAAGGAGSDGEALVFRARVLAMTGRAAPAREILEKVVETDPGNAAAHFELGRVLDNLKKYPEAVAEFEKAGQLRAGDPQTWDYLGLALERIGETARAEAAFRKGIEVNDQAAARFDGFLDYNYGRFLLKVNRPAESKAHLDRAVELAPAVRAVHYDHAKLNVRLGQLPAARRDAETALALADPGGVILDLQVYNLLAAICTRLGDAEAARKYGALAAQAQVPVRARGRE